MRDTVAEGSGKVRVLLVDDDDESRCVIAMLLIKKGFDVIEAADGLIALNVLHDDLHEQPDVIVSDLRMPIIDGFEFLCRYHGPIPVIVYSAYEMCTLPRVPYAVMSKPAPSPGSVSTCVPILQQAAAEYRAAETQRRLATGIPPLA